MVRVHLRASRNRSFILEVSAGFDAAEGDPLGECNITPSGFAQMTNELCSLADGRVVIVLEVRNLPAVEMALS